MKTGGNLYGYLGHFAGKDVLQAGHNQMPTGGANGAMTAPPTDIGAGASVPVGGPGRVAPAYNPVTNPIAATRQANQAAMRTARAGGNASAIQQQRLAGRTNLGEARALRQARNRAGLRSADMMALRGTRGIARAENRAARAGRESAENAPVQAARGALGTARQGVQAARKTLRQDIRSGNVADVSKAYQGLQTARAGRQSARQGLQSARKARR